MIQVVQKRLRVPKQNLGVGAWLYARAEVPREEIGKIDLGGMEIVSERRSIRRPRVDVRPDLYRAIDEALEDSVVVVARRHNAFVNLGLHFVLDRLFNLNTPNTAITHMGIADDASVVVAGTLLMNPAGGGSNINIKALATGVGATATSRTAETVACSAGWTKADANFVIVKVGTFNTSTDAGDDTVPTVQGVMNIIGGTGGASPYSEPFTIDLTGASAFNLTLSQEITVTAT